ncbi:hypothetical protein Cadr_000004071 [Camelus dromedarius]|uniref:Uncharacterized protein n=1 Tax=Camelus dromedarius TaxID=9838 RepID=A0A5N4EBU1_CAMDR|nr:hypothetical protein Cadr_000004071 [Camelus dromedarius]
MGKGRVTEDGPTVVSRDKSQRPCIPSSGSQQRVSSFQVPKTLVAGLWRMLGGNKLEASLSTAHWLQLIRFQDTCHRVGPNDLPVVKGELPTGWGRELAVREPCVGHWDIKWPPSLPCTQVPFLHLGLRDHTHSSGNLEEGSVKSGTQTPLLPDQQRGCSVQEGTRSTDQRWGLRRGCPCRPAGQELGILSCERLRSLPDREEEPAERCAQGPRGRRGSAGRGKPAARDRTPRRRSRTRVTRSSRRGGAGWTVLREAFREPGAPQQCPQDCIWHQAFFSFLDPHSHLATRPSSFPQSHAVPRVATSRNKRTSSRYCSYHGCWRAWGLRMWSIQPTSRWAGVRGWERLMMLAATTADLYLLAETQVRCLLRWPQKS